MYKDVPIVLSSDYLINNGLARNSQGDVYTQIIDDLKQAQSLLSVQYLDANGVVATNNYRDGPTGLPPRPCWQGYISIIKTGRVQPMRQAM